MSNLIVPIRKNFKIISVYTMSLLYILIGIKHFIDPTFFILITPSYINYKYEAVIISGIVEILLGILLIFKKTRRLASWGIIILLISVFPANIYLYSSDEVRKILNISKLQALIRMPFQLTLITISYWHSKKFFFKNNELFFGIIFTITIIYFLSI